MGSDGTLEGQNTQDPSKSGGLTGGGYLCFALLAAYLLSLRGQALFNTVFTRLLDVSPEAILSLAREARRLNLLEFREAGDVIEISFPRLLTPDETFLSYGQS